MILRFIYDIKMKKGFFHVSECVSVHLQIRDLNVYYCGKGIIIILKKRPISCFGF